MIEPWIQDLVGIKYEDGGDSPETGFYCVGLIRYIYRVKFNLELPDNPRQWKRMFKRLGWPTEVQPYDIFVLSNQCSTEVNFHMGIAADEREMIHTGSVFGQVVLQPIKRYSPSIRTSFRLR